jgi:hypothetical protein
MIFSVSMTSLILWHIIAMLSVVYAGCMLSDTYKPFILSGIKLHVIMLSAIKPNVIVLSAVMPIVVAPSDRNMVRHFLNIPGKTLVQCL